MSSRTTGNRSALKKSGLLLLAAGAVFAAVAPSLLTFGSQVGSAVASAELAAGAALQAQNGWIVPAAFTVMVFAMVVAAAMALTRPPAPRAQVTGRPQGHDRMTPIAFELREPERAMEVRLDRLPGATD